MRSDEIKQSKKGQLALFYVFGVGMEAKGKKFL